MRILQFDGATVINEQTGNLLADVRVVDKQIAAMTSDGSDKKSSRLILTSGTVISLKMTLEQLEDIVKKFAND